MFDINNIVEKYSIDLNQLAVVLFPKAKYKKQALDRILRGESIIDVDQLVKLAEYLNLEIQELFDNADLVSCKRISGFLTISKGDYKVVLHKDGFYMTFYFKDEVIGTSVTDTGLMTIENFIVELNKHIDKHQNNLQNGH